MMRLGTILLIITVVVVVAFFCHTNHNKNKSIQNRCTLSKCKNKKEEKNSKIPPVHTNQSRM